MKGEGRREDRKQRRGTNEEEGAGGGAGWLAVISGRARSDTRPALPLSLKGRGRWRIRRIQKDYAHRNLASPHYSHPALGSFSSAVRMAGYLFCSLFLNTLRHEIDHKQFGFIYMHEAIKYSETFDQFPTQAAA